jgi:hypothetical protein
MILDELIDRLTDIRRVHGGSMEVVFKTMETEEPDCQCRHYTGGEKREVIKDVESATAVLKEGKAITRKVLIK